MHHFVYEGGELSAESVPLRSIASAVGTPTYVYSKATLLRHLYAFSDAFSGRRHLVCYSVKANSNLAVLHLLGTHGAGMDVVSAGEIERVRRAGISGDRIVFSGVGKQEHEIVAALQADVRMINVESEDELDVVERAAASVGRRARIAVRCNPEVDARTHPYIATALRESKFGIAFDVAERLYERAARSAWIEVHGIDCHIGSQLVEVDPFVDAVRRVAGLVAKLRAAGIRLQCFDLGGGLGIAYREGTPPPPHPADYARAVIEALDEAGASDLEIVVEPGRAIVGNSGVLLTTVLYVKRTAAKIFVIVDAGMNDLVRPALYGSHHELLPVRRSTASSALERVDVVGPVCESGDFLAKDRLMAVPEPRDLLAVMSAGAYGFVMSSTYNARPRPAEVLVDGSRHHVIRERDTIESLMSGERIVGD